VSGSAGWRSRHPADDSGDSVHHCRVGTSRSGRSKATPMISIRGHVDAAEDQGGAAIPDIALGDRRRLNAAGWPRVQANRPWLYRRTRTNGAPAAFWTSGSDRC